MRSESSELAGGPQLRLAPSKSVVSGPLTRYEVDTSSDLGEGRLCSLQGEEREET